MKTQCPECSASFETDARGGGEDAQCPVCGAAVKPRTPDFSMPDFDLGNDLDDDFTAAVSSAGEDDDPFGGIEVGFLDDLAVEEISQPASKGKAPLAMPGGGDALDDLLGLEPAAPPVPAREPAAPQAREPIAPPAPAREPIAPPAPAREPIAPPARDRDAEVGFGAKAAHEISGLTEMDLSMIGSYSRTQRSLDAAADVVWSPGDARRTGRTEAPGRAEPRPDGRRDEARAEASRPEPRREEAPRREDDAPRSEPRRPATDDRPSGRPSGRASRPAVDVESPFGPAGGRGEAGRSDAAKADPFADVFGDDPFGEPAPSSSSSAPKPPREAAKGAADPFSDLLDDEPRPRKDPPRAAAPPRDERIDLGLDEMDFSSLLDGEPSAHGVAPPAPQKDRGAAAPKPEAEASDPFARSEDTNTFFIEAPSMAGFQEADAGGGAASDGDLFDLDAPKKKSKGAPLPPPDSGKGGGGKGGKAAKGAKGKKSRGAPLPAKALQVKAAKGGRGRQLALVGLLVVAALAVVPQLAGMGWFGLDALLGGPPKPKGPPTRPGGGPARPAQVAVAPGQFQQPVEDTTRAYRERIEALEGQLAGGPNGGPDIGATKQQLLAYYLEYSNRFPVNFQSNDRYKKRLDELSRQLGGQKDLRLQAHELMQQGKLEEAQAMLDQYVATAAADPDILAFYGEVALKRGNEDKALEYFRKSTELLPTYARGHYFTGRVLEAQGELAAAGEAFRAALQASPAHTQARLGLVRIELANRQVDDAIRDANEVLTAAQKEANTEDQFQAHLLLARAYFAKNDQEGRIRHLEAASQIRPDDEGTTLDLVELYTDAGALDKAEERLVACEKRKCGSSRFFQTAVSFYKDQRHSVEDAERFAQAAAAKHPEDPQILFLQAEIADARNLRKNARSLYQSVIDKSPAFVAAYGRLAEIYADEGRYDQAARVLEQGISNAPASTGLMGQLADMMVATGQRVKAKDVYKDLVGKDPSNSRVRLKLAALYGDLGFAKEAIEQYEVLKGQGALDPAATLDYADMLAKAGQHKKAIGELEAVLTADPQSVEANARLGAMYAAIQSYTTARKYLEMALKLNPGYAPAFFELGRIALALDDPDLAITQLQKAVSASPRDVAYRHSLANALLKKGGAASRKLALSQYDAIVKDYDGAGTQPGFRRDPDVYIKRGGLLFDSGKYREALKDFEDAMLIDPGHLESIASYAETLYKLKKVREAESYFREILSKDSGNATASYYLGKIALQKGSKQQAMDYFAASVRGGGPQYPDAHKTLGYMYREKNMTALARREFELYLKHAEATAYDREEVERVLGRLR